MVITSTMSICRPYSPLNPMEAPHTGTTPEFRGNLINKFI